MTTKDEALRVAREALEQISKVGYGLDSSDDDAAQADYWAGKAIHQRELARSALRTIALAVEAPSDGVEVDRDSDGELLIDWSPSPGRMLTMSLRHDGRLSYAFRWDGEQAHGTAQMPSAVQSVALGEPKAHEFCRFPDCKCPMDPGPEPDWCAKGLPHTAGLPGTSNGQENGNG